ncbi:F-box protein, partial [Trifolium medium]|nr:F-box protein [Trifolium medium]
MNMFRNNFLSYNDPSSLILNVVENHERVFYSFSGDSVNGTVLCLFIAGNCNIVLWNPATNAIKYLPPSEVGLVKLSMPDEAENYVEFNADYYVHGFGYDYVINDYKVIRYVDVSVDSSSEYSEDWLEDLECDSFWEIYILRSNSWRKLHIDMPYSLQCNDGTQVYMDGVCHWLCEEDKPCLVSFYLSNEEFFVTPTPSDVDDCFDVKALWINLAVLNGFIALISYYKETTTFHISILGEIGTKESWTKLIIAGPLSCVERPIGVGMKGQIVFRRKDEELVWLDLRTQMIAELG